MSAGSRSFAMCAAVNAFFAGFNSMLAINQHSWSFAALSAGGLVIMAVCIREVMP